MPRRSSLRASDAEREQVAERLRAAAGEGRLLAEELEHRLSEALRAKTHGELDALVADLPGRRVARRERRNVPTVATVAGVALAAVVAVAVIAAVALVLAGLFMVWAVWAVFAWWFLRRGRIARRRHTAGPPLRFTSRRGAL